MAAKSDPMPPGLLAGMLPQLDIPSTARLTGVSTSVEDDGSTTWTVTYKSPAPGKASGTPNGAASATTAVVEGDSDGARNRVFALRCDVKTYAWGRLGLGSTVARLATTMDPEFEAREDTPYAELWMGTHPSGPSLVTLTTPWRSTTPLYEWLKLNPALNTGQPLGRAESVAGPGALRKSESMAAMQEHGLPFLFKILSVRTALSIQAHPDKRLARELHAARPDMYKDDNHKPEMCLAITKFEALCSFQRAASVLENVRACPELAAVVGEESLQALATAVAGGAGAVKAALKQLFTALMTAEPALVEAKVEALAARIQRTSPMLRTPVDELAARLYEQYPKDGGVFCVYLLNYKALQPGEALYLGANEPHAYLSGDCAEAMATSDNVVRAGLTPKWKDVATLTSMLTYRDGPPHTVLPEQLGPHVQRYDDYSSTEFLIDRVVIPAGSNDAATLPPAPGVSIIIFLEGVGSLEESAEGAPAGAAGRLQSVEAGKIFMICPGTVLRLQAAPQATLLAFRACAKYATKPTA